MKPFLIVAIIISFLLITSFEEVSAAVTNTNNVKKANKKKMPNKNKNKNSNNNGDDIFIPPKGVVPDYKALMPSVLHLTAVDFKSNAFHRLFIQMHKPSFMMFHTPHHAYYLNGELYKNYEEVVKRLGSFVAFGSINVEDIPLDMALKGFQLNTMPAFRFWPIGRRKKMYNYPLPRVKVADIKSDSLVLADEFEDFVLDTLIKSERTLMYDYLNLDQYVPTSEDCDDVVDIEKGKKQDNNEDSNNELVLESESSSSSKGTPDEDSGDDISPEEEERRKKCMEKKQEREITHAIKEQTAKHKVFIVTITLPEDPSTAFMFAEETTIERQVRRLEAMVHALAIHTLSHNNIRWAIVKNADTTLVDSLRVKIEVRTKDEEDVIIITDEEHSLKELTEIDKPKSSSTKVLPNQVKLRIPLSLSFTQLSKIVAQHTKPDLPKELLLNDGQAIDKPITTLENRDKSFWLKLKELWDVPVSASAEEQSEEERDTTSINVRYRKVYDDCTSLKECADPNRKTKKYLFSEENEISVSRAPFIVRNAKEFREPPTNIKSAEDLVRIYSSNEMSSVEVDGQLPTFDYRKTSVQEITKRWSKKGDDFETNMFQAHVNRSTFPFKLPPVFDEVSPIIAVDSSSRREGTKLTKKQAINHRKGSPPSREKAHVLLSPQFTNKGAYTMLHFDPVAHGGGYMYLAHGTKHWQFIHPRHATVAVPVVQELGDMNLDYPERFFNLSAPDEVVPVKNKNNNRKEIGKKYYFDVYCGTMNAGDLIVFPPGWLHRVFTGEEENTIGAVGYMFIDGGNDDGNDDWEDEIDAAIEVEDAFMGPLENDLMEKLKSLNKY